MNRLFKSVIYFLVLPLVLLSYLLEPFTSDVRIYLGTAKVALLTGGFPMNLDTVWESRFVGHRFLYYVLNLLSPFDGWLYSIWMKLIVAVVMIIVLYYFSKRLSELMQVSFDYPFVIGFLGLFAVNNFVIFSAESHSVVIGMLMFTLLVDRRNWVVALSGLLLLPLATLKGLPGLVVPIVLLAVIMLVPDWKVRFVKAAYSVPVALAGYVALALYYPHFISDIILLGKLAHVARLEPMLAVQYFIKYGIGVIGFAPVVLIGLFMTVMILSMATKEHLRDLVPLTGMWVIASLYVLVISEFFYYHYFLMLIPAIITICYFLKIYDRHELAFTLIVVSVLVIFAAVVAGWSAGLAFEGYKHWSDRDRDVAGILSEFDITDQPTTLYLDSGEASYYFTTRSECRYVGALPIQRHMPDWDMTGYTEYWEMRNCSLGYTGKYVILDPLWMNLSVVTHNDVANKLSNEYVLVNTTERWSIYERRLM